MVIEFVTIKKAIELVVPPIKIPKILKFFNKSPIKTATAKDE